MYVFAQTLGQNLPKVAANQATLNTVLNFVYVIVGLLAVVFIVVGGVRYTLSGGDASKIAQAKNTILYAIVGLIVAILAFAITNFILGSVKATSYNALRDSIINTLIGFGALLAVVMIVYGAFRYVTSNGDASRIKGAKDTILYAVIGLVISILAFAIVNFVLGNI